MTRYLSAFAVAIVVAVLWIRLLPARPLPQPMHYNHAVHTEMMDCEMCHVGARSAERAGIPQVDLCASCHEEAPPNISTAQWEQVVSDRAIAWQRVTRLPTHAFFSHRRHAGIAAIECTTCHGDIPTRTVAVTSAPIHLDMAACLSCHAEEGASDDCAACHR
jgi:predicted CXXCH cytochrome family protein